MVCGVIGFKWQIFWKQNSQKEQETLEKHLLPFDDFLGNPEWRFQHGNASIYNSHSTEQWLSAQNVNILDWPDLNLDIQPTENIWGTLNRDVFKTRKKYDSAKEPKLAIEKSMGRTK